MSATAEQIAQVRRMVAEPTDAVYSDAQIQSMIESHSLMDVNGIMPYILQSVTTNPINTPNPLWIPTYDLNFAAADIWQEKAGAAAGDYDFSADGAQILRGQVYRNAMQQARFYLSRRSPRTITMTASYPGDAITGAG